MKRYEPPVQSKAMQVVDIAFLLVAIFVTLWLPLELGLAGAAKEIQPIENPTWESLQQTPGQVVQWEKLGYDAAKAHDVIQNKFNYVLAGGDRCIRGGHQRVSPSSCFSDSASISPSRDEVSCSSENRLSVCIQSMSIQMTSAAETPHAR